VVIVPRHWLVWLSDLLVGIRGGGWPGRAANVATTNPVFLLLHHVEDAAGSSAVYLSARSCQDPALDGWVWRDVPGASVSLGKAAKTLGVAIGRDVCQSNMAKPGWWATVAGD
jgi:hypothetical protein